MSIRDLTSKIKGWRLKAINADFPEVSADKYYTAAIILLVGFSSFGLGRLSAVSEGGEPVTIEERAESLSVKVAAEPVSGSAQSASVAQSMPAVLPSGGKVVASKNGTKYYFPWCGGVSKIAETNKVWFNSVDEARAKGYEPAANCKGLK
jgi:hypothetical protein